MKKTTCILSCLLLSAYASFAQTKPSDNAIKVTSRDTVSTIATSMRSVDTLYRTDVRNDVTIFYRFDRPDIDKSYFSNKEALEFIDSKLSDSLIFNNIDSLSLSAVSSPEGPFSYNKRLSQRRVESFRDYLIKKYPNIEPKIRTGHSGEGWNNLREMVAESTQIPNKEEVLEIIDSDASFDTKEYRLKRLNGGRPWQFIQYNMLKYLRFGGTAIFHYSVRRILGFPSLIGDAPVTLSEPSDKTLKFSPVPITLYERKPLFAVKTNLLYDVASVLNISFEVPLSKRISLSAEWVFPWWVFDNGTATSMRHRLQLLYGNIEARYWFGNREDKPIMTGWFAGLYGGSGKYDFEYSKDGVQGEFYSAGLTAGYAHSINKANTLRMEYSINGGYLNSNYRDYNAIFTESSDKLWHPIRTKSGEYSALTPTAVKVSLVWMLHYNRKVKGGAQ